MPYFLTNLINHVDHSLSKSIVIFLISLFSNTFAAISGGGAGLVQLPALILSGIPYYQALACHKLATVFLGIGSSLRNYNSLREDSFILWQILIFGLPGVVLGASIVEFISEQYLYLVLGIVSILIALYSFRSPKLGLLSPENKPSRFNKITFILSIFLIGILNGSISSGTGLLVTILLIKTFGMDFLRAISLTFFTVGIFWNFTGAFFLSKIGLVPSNIMLLLIVGSFLGGFIGAHLSKLKGNLLVKNTFTVICLLVGSLLLLKSFSFFM